MKKKKNHHNYFNNRDILMQVNYLIIHWWNSRITPMKAPFTMAFIGHYTIVMEEIIKMIGWSCLRQIQCPHIRTSSNNYNSQASNMIEKLKNYSRRSILNHYKQDLASFVIWSKRQKILLSNLWSIKVGNPLVIKMVGKKRDLILPSTICCFNKIRIHIVDITIIMNSLMKKVAIFQLSIPSMIVVKRLIIARIHTLHNLTEAINTIKIRLKMIFKNAVKSALKWKKSMKMKSSNFNT